MKVLLTLYVDFTVSWLESEENWSIAHAAFDCVLREERGGGGGGVRRHKLTTWYRWMSGTM